MCSSLDTGRESEMTQHNKATELAEAIDRYAGAKAANLEAQRRYINASADAEEAHQAYLKAYQEYKEATLGCV